MANERFKITLAYILSLGWSIAVDDEEEVKGMIIGNEDFVDEHAPEDWTIYSPPDDEEHNN
jgi:hypothetical protein